MDLLVIGGTRFLGRHVVDVALDRGDRVTIVHRGGTPTHRPGDVEEVLADRADADVLAGLLRHGRRFDGMVDTCGYHPATVLPTYEALAPGVVRAVFVSTVSVYADQDTPGIDEDRAVSEPPDPMPSAFEAEQYGPLKVACERAVSSVLGDRTTVVRPGLIGGPYDPTDRCTYWALRREDPGPVLAPAVPDAPVQVIDARDLAQFCLRLLDDDRAGTFNATHPEPVSFGSLLAGCDVVWAPEDVLLANDVAPWVGLPLWIPRGSGADALMAVDVTRAVAAGLRCRPLADTLTDTAAWARAVRADPDAAGTSADSAVLPRGRERELLALLARPAGD